MPARKGKRKPRVELTCSERVTEKVLAAGYAFFPGSSLKLTEECRTALAELTVESEELPEDPRAEEGTRHRRYGRFLYMPWNETLSLRPVNTYLQDPAINPSDGGVVREFAPLTDTMVGNEFLDQLIRLDFAMLPISEGARVDPWDIGVHVIQMIAHPGKPGVSSPDCFHKDGEPWTYVHLLTRRDVIGGESEVADNERTLLFSGTLTDPLDSILVRDEAVYHRVARIEVSPGRTEGVRTVVLIDFTPMKAVVNRYVNAA